MPGDDELSTKNFVVTTSQIIKAGESEKVTNLFREREGRGVNPVTTKKPKSNIMQTARL